MYLTHFKYPPSCILLIDPIYHLTCILFILYTILHASYSSYIPSYMHPIYPIYHPICILLISYTPSMYLTHFKYPLHVSYSSILNTILHASYSVNSSYNTILHASYSPIYHPTCILFILYHTTCILFILYTILLITTEFRLFLLSPSLLHKLHTQFLYPFWGTVLLFRVGHRVIGKTIPFFTLRHK